MLCLSWHPDLFVAGWRLGRLSAIVQSANWLQRGAVGLDEWGSCSRLRGWLVGVAVVVELCASMVGCHEHEGMEMYILASF